MDDVGHIRALGLSGRAVCRHVKVSWNLRNKTSYGPTHQKRSSRTRMTLYMASSLTKSSSTGNTRQKEFERRQASLTLLILNSPSKRHPWPLLSGTFIEFSMWPTSCRPISSWMSKPTTAGTRPRGQNRGKEIQTIGKE